MGYKDLNIRISYETTNNRNMLLDDFYIPMLEQTKQYFRIAGFFSSSSLAVAAKGIEGLINNNGFMRLLISPRLSEQDAEIIRRVEQDHLPESLSLFQELDFHDFYRFDNLQALSWMLANKRLEIKLVVDKHSNESIFHQKIGIGYDADGDLLSFSGSINETAQAWLSNIEEFKTFKSWEQGQREYLIADLRKFNEYWNGERDDIATVFSLPDAIKQRIIEVSPRDVSDLSIMKKYKDKQKEKKQITDIGLFSHQRKAVAAWEANDHRLLMEMATGTGKTRTAIGCALCLLSKLENFLIIVATPQNTLSRQWKDDVESLGIQIEFSKIIDGSNNKWRLDLETCLLNLNLKYSKNAIIYTTHVTASSDDFINIIKKNQGNTEVLFICDEVHAIGSEHQQNGLLDIYKYRVGLSATPNRMYDEEGTQLIRDYFGNKSFEFTIRDALGTINPLTGKPFLNQFYYHPIFVDLTDEEQNRYAKLSKTIAVLANKDDVDPQQIDMLKIRRANILKNAAEKLQTVENIIVSLNEAQRITDTIVFATDKQIEPLLQMLSAHSISRCKITEEESASKRVGTRGNTERQEYIDQFRDGRIQVLVGIKCLDEGIDIKTARTAILMASSNNPREYVQRVGRVIRTGKNKGFSHIYDLIVCPSRGDSSSIGILQKEARRAMMIANNAVNVQEVVDCFERKGVKLDANQ